MIDHLKQWDPSDWSDGVTMHLATASAAIPVYYRHRLGADRLLVLLPSAVDRERADVGFQRASWADDFDAHILAVADPTLLADPGLAIGWFQGVGGGPLIGDLASWIDRHSRALGVDAGDVTLFGSSAGGFAGLKLAEHLPDARVIAVNPQIFLDRYAIEHFAAMLAVSYPALSAGDAVAKIADALWVRRETASRSATTIIVQNWADRLHYKMHLMPYLDAIDCEPPEPTELEVWCATTEPGAFEVVVYCDFNRGHVPPDRPVETRLINTVIGMNRNEKS